MFWISESSIDVLQTSNRIDGLHHNYGEASGLCSVAGAAGWRGVTRILVSVVAGAGAAAVSPVLSLSYDCPATSLSSRDDTRESCPARDGHLRYLLSTPTLAQQAANINTSETVFSVMAINEDRTLILLECGVSVSIVTPPVGMGPGSEG